MLPTLDALVNALVMVCNLTPSQVISLGLLDDKTKLCQSPNCSTHVSLHVGVTETTTTASPVIQSTIGTTITNTVHTPASAHATHVTASPSTVTAPPDDLQADKERYTVVLEKALESVSVKMGGARWTEDTKPKVCCLLIRKSLYCQFHILAVSHSVCSLGHRGQRKTISP